MTASPAAPLTCCNGLFMRLQLRAGSSEPAPAGGIPGASSPSIPPDVAKGADFQSHPAVGGTRPLLACSSAGGKRVRCSYHTNAETTAPASALQRAQTTK